MALEAKIGVPKQNRDGRVITVTDATGLMVLGRDTGYGDPGRTPDDITAHYFSFSRYNDSNVYLFKLDGTQEYLPTNKQIAEGYPLNIRSNMFSEGNDGSRSEIFRDGVLDINMYVEFEGMSDVVIGKGRRYVVFPEGVIGNFTPILSADAVSVNDTIYQIDKSEDNNGATVFYIIGEFEETATSFNILYRSNIKVLLTAVSDYLHSFAVKRLKHDMGSPEWEKVNTALSFMTASKIWFSEGDPVEAHEEIVAANKLLNRYTL